MQTELMVQVEKYWLVRYLLNTCEILACESLCGATCNERWVCERKLSLGANRTSRAWISWLEWAKQLTQEWNNKEFWNEESRKISFSRGQFSKFPITKQHDKAKEKYKRSNDRPTREQSGKILVPGLPLRLPMLTELYHVISRLQILKIVTGYILQNTNESWKSINLKCMGRKMWRHTT